MAELSEGVDWAARPPRRGVARRAESIHFQRRSREIALVQTRLDTIRCHGIVPAEMKTHGSSPSKAAKRAYHQPVLREYGSVASLTAGGQGSAADGAGMFSMMEPPMGGG